MGNAPSAEDAHVGRPFKARPDISCEIKLTDTRMLGNRSDGRWYWRWGRQWYVYDGAMPARVVWAGLGLPGLNAQHRNWHRQAVCPASEVQTCCRFVRGWIAYDPLRDATDDFAGAQALSRSEPGGCRPIDQDFWPDE